MSILNKLYARIRYGSPVIVVSGLPRSGTSMTMKMLEAVGLGTVTDGQRVADEDNPKGYFEDERVKDLHKTEDKTWIRDARGKAIKVISYLLKDLPRDNFYKVVFMRRNLNEVLASQKKMLDRRGEKSETNDERMIEIYKDHLWKVNWMFKHSSNIEALDIEYQMVIQDPRTQATRIREFLGLDIDVEKMVAAVDPSLYRNRS
ncbi:MAG: sulfotransferase domain-containing protein [Acidobacteria bacterium]|nr:sulfotransferase domain-containing protein [Acidobacteriota bacterium]